MQQATPSVLAIFVSFNPDIEVLRANLETLIEQGCDCYVVDNGSQHTQELAELAQLSHLAHLAHLAHFGERLKSVSIDLQASNLGLGAAQNLGIKVAQTKGYDYCILFDQDSRADPEMVTTLISAHKTKSTANSVAAVGPIYRNQENGSESVFVRFGALKFQRVSSQDADEDGCIETDFLISSGSLFRVDVFEKVGLMDETLFIDHVDTEWFLRAHALGLRSFGVARAQMSHALGEATHAVKLGSRQRNVPQHKPFRYYYIFRNSIALYKRGGLSWKWKWNDLQRLLMIFVMFGLCTAPRRKNLAMMVQGSWHGLIGKMGPKR